MFNSLISVRNEAQKKTDTQSRRFVEAVDSMLAAHKAGEVWNADLGGWKSAASRYLEKSHDQIYDVGRDLPENERNDFFNAFPRQLFGMQSINAWINGMPKYAKLVPDFIPYVLATSELKKLLAELKPMIKSGRKPKANADPNAFVKPVADYKIQKQVLDVFRKTASGFRANFVKNLHQRLVTQVAVIRQNEPYASFRDFKKLKNPDIEFLAQRIMIRVRGGSYELDPKWMETVQKMAERRADEIIDHFCAKNTDKVALIAQRKTMSSHKIVKTSINNGILENTMQFEFEDGSSFTLYSQVEYAYSPRGVPFIRFPTRFTDVKLADGSRMSRPSEEKMIKEF